MTTSTMPLILCLCGDPGGAGAAAPVIKRMIHEKRVDVLALAYNEAAITWQNAGIPHQVLKNNLTPARIRQLLQQTQPAVLFTGTSVNPINYEKIFTAEARGLGIPSLALLDFWLNYSWRFSNDKGELVYLPDIIAVMDTLARDEMIAEGFPPDMLVITGQPAFDDLAAWKERFTADTRVQLRKRLGIAPQEHFVLFLSQPQSSLYGNDKVNGNHIGFDEWDVLYALVDALETIAQQDRERIHLIIRPHPREDIAPFTQINSPHIRITATREGGPRHQVMAADLVVGMNTELLVEACYLDCITLSLQPGLRQPDRLPTNRAGVTRAVYTYEEILPVVREVLLDESERARILDKVRNYTVEGNATERVIQLIYHLAHIFPASEEVQHE